MNELLKLMYTLRDEFSAREFDCLFALIEAGTISTFKELAAYGVEGRMNEQDKLLGVEE